MTSKESLFNKGIFKTVLRRFRLGGLLYFIILFLCVPTMFLTQSPEVLINRYYGRYNSVFDRSVIFNNDFMISPTLITMIVPTVVALLVFNFAHSQRHAIFIHSLPVKRKANYFSSLCGAFTLMALPVMLNALILIIMSLCGYDKIIGIVPSIVWMLVLLCVLFIMFSVATLASFLAGNPFAAAAINLIIHLLPLGLAASVSLFGTRYLYGFCDDGDVFESIIKASPIVNLFENLIGNNAYSFFKNVSVWIFLVISVLFFFLAYFLYKKRRMELSGDVAAFKILHPILKYTICSGAFILAFGIFTSIDMNAFWYFILSGLITAIVYFASEMVLKKNLRVFYLYKGLIGFFVATALVLSFVAFTSVFGFETRVPKAEKVESVAVFTDYSNEIPYVTDAEIIKKAIEFHNEFLKDIPMLEEEMAFIEEPYAADSSFDMVKTIRMNRIFFKYKLNNGKILSRRYYIDNEFEYKILSSLFESIEYKNKVTGIEKINPDNVRSVNVSTSCGNMHYEITLNEDSGALFHALKKDIEKMTYDDYISSSPLHMHVSLGLSYEENLVQKIFKQSDNTHAYYHFSSSIYPSFENAIKLLREKGYLEELETYYGKNLYVSTEPVYYDNDVYTFKDKDFDPNSKILIGEEFLRKLTPEESSEVFENVLIKKSNYKSTPFAENYYLFCADTIRLEQGLAAANNIARYSPDTIPEWLK